MKPQWICGYERIGLPAELAAQKVVKTTPIRRGGIQIEEVASLQGAGSIHEDALATKAAKSLAVRRTQHVIVHVEHVLQACELRQFCFIAKGRVAHARAGPIVVAPRGHESLGCKCRGRLQLIILRRERRRQPSRV